MEAHINVKPPKLAVYETPDQAINHVFMFGLWSKNWEFGRAFGQTIAERRAIDAAIKERNYAAFTAHKRRGYWRIELNTTHNT